MGGVAYTVIVKPKAEKQLRKLPEQYKGKIKSAFRYLAHDPFSGKKLKGDHQGEYTISIWPYLIIYNISQRTVTVFVLAIGHRQGVYK